MTQFGLVFRGYDRTQVDAFVQKVDDATGSGDPARRSKVQADAQAVSFGVVMRGYNREEVDHYLRRVAKGRPDDRGPGR